MTSPDNSNDNESGMQNSVNTDLEKVVEELETRSTRRDLVGVYRQAVRLLLITSSLFNLYTTGVSSFSTMDQRGLHVLFMLTPVFLMKAGSKKSGQKVTAHDILISLTAMACSIYAILSWRHNLDMLAEVSGPALFFGTAMILVIIEAARRSTGPALAIVAFVFILYALFGQNLPGIFSHPPISYNKMVSFMFQTTEGIYGIPISVSSTYLVIFVLFGAFLKNSGAGQFFIDFNYSWAGRFRGGPAKTAVVASSLMGTISGSPLANVVTVGTFTIPLMKHAGYRPHVAGAIEALASTGGNIMPPVMGAAAFLMAEYLGVSYWSVCLAAIIPAVLFFISVFVFTDLEALKTGMIGLPKEKLPEFFKVLRQGWIVMIPLAALVVFLALRWTPIRAAFWACLLVLIIGVLNPYHRITLRKIITSLEEGSREVVPIAVACAAAGLIVGTMGVTGLGVKFSSGLISLSGGNPLIALFFTMLGAIVLGMGMPISAVYILLAALVPPALGQMGISPLAAHMFIFYFSAVAGLTPPVALTAYAAAGISQSDPGRTGWAAFNFGLVAYIVPYFFVYSPSLLMQGSTNQIIFAAGTAILGTCCFAIGLHDYLGKKLKYGLISRVLFVVGGLLMIQPGFYTDIPGLASLILAWIISSKSPLKKSWKAGVLKA